MHLFDYKIIKYNKILNDVILQLWIISCWNLLIESQEYNENGAESGNWTRDLSLTKGVLYH